MPGKASARIFVNDSLGEVAARILAAYEIVGPEADEASLAGCDAAMVWPLRVSDATWKSLSGLRAVQTFTAGVDAVNFKLIPQGAQVLWNSAFADAVGEHAWALLTGTAAGVHLRKAKATPHTLRNGRLVVVGCGAIGSEVARIGRESLSMKTVGVSRSFRHPEYFDETHPLSDLDAVVATADALVLALPLSVKTLSLFDYGTLSRTKDTVVIANVGRGELVEEDALFRLLTERPETRYVTDVFWQSGGKESFDTKLWELDNFAGTLHVAGTRGGPDAMEQVKAAASENLRLFLTTGRANNQIDRRDYL